MKQVSYHEQKKRDLTIKLREQLSELPDYVTDFFRGRETTTSPRTRISYAYDIKIFMNYLLVSNPSLKGKTIRDISLDVLDRLEAVDIEEYLEYLKLYEDSATGTQISNDLRGIARKLSSLRSLYAYLFKRGMIEHNPTVMVDMPKLHNREIIQLDPDEVAILLDYMEECGSELSPHKRAYYHKTIIRDLAIITLLLGTGIRVSECVGLDISDVDLKNDGIRVVRKGGNEMIVYFGPEVEIALLNYLEERETIEAQPGHENALFLSMQKRRISDDAVENLVKKYTQAAIPQKKITPHKLRSTYGTNLYRETGDIYLVADVLGHSDVNTTRKHYAKTGDTRRRQAATAVHLRED